MQSVLNQKEFIKLWSCVGFTRKVFILFLQEVKRDIIFRRTQLSEPRCREELRPRIQTHLLSVITKIQALLEYQGVLNYNDALVLLRCMAHSVLNDWVSFFSFHTLSLSTHVPLPHTTYHPYCTMSVHGKKNSKIQNNKTSVVVHKKARPRAGITWYTTYWHRSHLKAFQIRVHREVYWYID
jgi:hypothetical protein